MSWGMPPAAGQWNPNMGMGMDPSMGMGMAPNANMGNYTPDQWVMMQQQNWQQWSQWQQQYAQWQTEYGEKYAQQMQAMQTMPTMPPLPANVAPPAPPPPDKPPPPPLPHENNQPLYGGPPKQTSQVPAPAQRNANTGYNNTNFTGNNQNVSYTSTQNQPDTNQSAVNLEALKKLAEEERLFNIQFQKWEEEIEKWKKENANHPDKDAYREYEAKFDACRVNLLERRDQMKLKKARLLGIAPPAANTAPTGNNIPPAGNIVPPAGNIVPPAGNASSNITPHMQTAVKPTNYVQNNMQSQNYNSIPSHNSSNQNITQNQQLDNTLSTGYNRNINTSVDAQNHYNTMENYSADNSNASFLPANANSKGIPGLDLVPEADVSAAHTQNVIDITEDQSGGKKAPDYSTISKGINNILGDEKIMNILSMVRDQVPGGNPQDNLTNIPGDTSKAAATVVPAMPYGYGGPSGSYGAGASVVPGMPYGYGATSGSYGAGVPYGFGGPVMGSYGSGGPMAGLYGPGGSYGPSGPIGGSYGPSGGSYGTSGESQGPGGQTGTYGSNTNNYNMPPNNQWDRKDTQQNNQQFGNRLNVPFNRQGPPPPPPTTQTPAQARMYNDGQNKSQYGGQNMGPRPLMSTPVMPPDSFVGRPPLLEIPVQQNNTNNRGMHNSRGLQENEMPINQHPKTVWEDPLFTPSIIVEYEHKPLRSKVREFIEPVHMFDYDHKSKEEEYSMKDFEKEVEELFTRKPRWQDDEFTNDRGNRFPRDAFGREPYARELSRDFERRPREEINESYDYFSRVPPPREEYDDRRRVPPREDAPSFDRWRDDQNSRRDDQRGRDDQRTRDFRDTRDRGDARDSRDARDTRDSRDVRDGRDAREVKDLLESRVRDRFRDFRRDEAKPRSKSRDIDSRKRGRSKESEVSDHSKKSKENETKPVAETPKHMIMIDDLIEPPGRDMRPEKIVIMLRGPPGSGKSYLAKLIRDRESEHGGSARIMSIDDYFMQEGDYEEKDPITGKMVKKPTLKYEYDEKLEESYLSSLKRAFKRTITDGYYNFLIYDAVNEHLRNYADVWNFARQNGFQVYTCTMELDPHICFKRNIHNRTLEDIQVICARFFQTPSHHLQLDATTLLQNAAITDVQMEDATNEVIMEEPQDEVRALGTNVARLPPPQVETSFTSKWEKMDDAARLARLDGTSKPLRPSQLSMADYLQLDDWTPTKAQPGKKCVRWADIEERSEQEKMRAIGFVVGQTDWHRMTDPTMGSSALTQTKYIERVRRN